MSSTATGSSPAFQISVECKISTLLLRYFLSQPALMELPVLAPHIATCELHTAQPAGLFSLLPWPPATIHSGPPPEMASFMSFWGATATDSPLPLCRPIPFSVDLLRSVAFNSFSGFWAEFLWVNLSIFSKRKTYHTYYFCVGTIQICMFKTGRLYSSPHIPFLHIPQPIATPALFKASAATHSLSCSIYWWVYYPLFKFFIVLTAITILVLSIYYGLS